MAAAAPQISANVFKTNKFRVIIGGWAVGIGTATAWELRKRYKGMERHPYLLEAQTLLESDPHLRQRLGSPVTMKWWSLTSSLDSFSKYDRCKFKVSGPEGDAVVYTGAVQAQPKAKGELKVDEWYDLEEDDRGLQFYWENPWEVKAGVVNSVASIVERFGYEMERRPWQTDLEEAETRRSRRWFLRNCFAVVNGDRNDIHVLVGDPQQHPDYIQLSTLAISAKNEKTKKRMKYGGIFVACALALTVIRFGRKSYRRAISYGYVRKLVLQNPTVQKIFGENIRVIDSRGSFQNTFVSGHLELMDHAGTQVGNVEVVAQRRDKTSSWRVVKMILDMQNKSVRLA